MVLYNISILSEKLLEYLSRQHTESNLHNWLILTRCEMLWFTDITNRLRGGEFYPALS